MCWTIWTEIPVCVEYQVDGESVEDMPPLSEDLGKVRPVHRESAGMEFVDLWHFGI